MRLQLQGRRFRFSLRQPLRTAAGVLDAREGWLLRIEASNGALGWGEVAPLDSAERPLCEGAPLFGPCAPLPPGPRLAPTPLGARHLHRAAVVGCIAARASVVHPALRGGQPGGAVTWAGPLIEFCNWINHLVGWSVLEMSGNGFRNIFRFWALWAKVFRIVGSDHRWVSGRGPSP